MATYFKIKDCMLDTNMQQSQPATIGGGIASPCTNPFGNSDLIINQDSNSGTFSNDPSNPLFYDSTSRLRDVLSGAAEPPYVNYVKVRITNISNSPGVSSPGLRTIIPKQDVFVRICCPGRTQFMYSDFHTAEGLGTGGAYFIEPKFYDEGGLLDTDPFDIPQDSSLVLVYGISDAQLTVMRTYGSHYCIIAEVLTQDRTPITGALITANVDSNGAPSGSSPINAVAWGYRRLAQRNIDRVLF